MHRPSAEKLWQIPDSTAFPMLPAFPFRPTPLEVQATSYLAPSVNIFSFSCMLKFSWISILNFPSLNKYAGSPFPPSVWFGCQAHSHICQHLCSGNKNVCSVFYSITGLLYFQPHSEHLFIIICLLIIFHAFFLQHKKGMLQNPGLIQYLAVIFLNDIPYIVQAHSFAIFPFCFLSQRNFGMPGKACQCSIQTTHYKHIIRHHTSRNKVLINLVKSTVRSAAPFALRSLPLGDVPCGTLRCLRSSFCS